MWNRKKTCYNEETIGKTRSIKAVNSTDLHNSIWLWQWYFTLIQYIFMDLDCHLTF